MRDGRASEPAAPRPAAPRDLSRQLRKKPPPPSLLPASNSGVAVATTFQHGAPVSRSPTSVLTSSHAKPGVTFVQRRPKTLPILSVDSPKSATEGGALSNVVLPRSPPEMRVASFRSPGSPHRLPTIRSPKGEEGTNRLGNGYGMFCEPWRRERAIGSGQFGTVYKAKNLRTGDALAVKQVRITSAATLEQMIDEVNLMCRASFRNENVVGCLGWSVSDGNISELITANEKFGMQQQSLDEINKRGSANCFFNVFMEFVEKGSLSDLLEKHGPMSEATMRNYMRQLLLGIRSLHAAGIAHRDIKCQNLLLSKSNTLKVADFGSAKKVVKQTMGASSIQGSIPWMSPEVIRQEVGKAGEDDAAKLQGWKLADVWSIGCTMIEIISGKPPWENFSNPAAMMFAIANSEGPPKIPDNVRIHDDGVDFLNKCCAKSPQDRPSVAKLIYHPYMREKGDVDEDEDD